MMDDFRVESIFNAISQQCSCPAVMEWHRRRNVLGAVHYSFLLAATGLTVFSSFSVWARR